MRAVPEKDTAGVLAQNEALVGIGLSLDGGHAAWVKPTYAKYGHTGDFRSEVRWLPLSLSPSGFNQASSRKGRVGRRKGLARGLEDLLIGFLPGVRGEE